MIRRSVLSAIGGLLFVCGFAPSAQAQVTGFQEYFVPGREDQLRTIFRNFSVTVGNDMHAVISVTAGSDGTKVYYDHWEDGYDFNPLNPDATADEVFLIDGGQSRKLESANIPSNPRLASQTFYDGADRLFTVGRTIAVTRASWPETPGPNLAVVWEVYPERAGTTSYVIPIGEDFYPPPKKADDYAQVYVLVMSLEDGNIINIDDTASAGNPNATFTLNRGQTNLTTFRTKGPAIITGTKRLEAQFIGGVNQGGNNLMRSLSVPPTVIWGNSYVSPVPSFPGVNTETYVYNPNASPLTVTGVDNLGTVVYTVPGGSTIALSDQVGGRYVPQNSSLRLSATSNFWAYGAVGLGNNDYDWTFNFVNEALLEEFNAIPWGPGSTGNPPTQNGSPLFITPAQDDTYVFVDFSPGDGIEDQVLLLDRGQVAKVFDADKDNSGTRVTSIGKVAITWGQDSTVAGTTSPYFDLGYSMPPLLDNWIDRVLDVSHTASPATLGTNGGSVTMAIEAATFSYPVSSVDLREKMPTGFTYVPGSTLITFPDGSTATAPEPSIVGQVLTWDLNVNMPVNKTLRVTFRSATSDLSQFGPNRFDGTAIGNIGSNVFSPTAPAFVFFTPPPTVNKTLYLHPDGTNFAADGARDLDRVQNASGASTVVRVNDGVTQSWVLTPALARDLGIPSNIVSRIWLDPTTGTGLPPDITLRLKAGSTLVGQQTLNDVNSPLLEYTFTIIPLSVVVPAGQAITLEISVSGSVDGFADISFNSATHNSRIEAIPTYTYIRVASTSTHLVAYPALSPAATVDQGGMMSVRALVRDPFGAYDINSVTATIKRNGVNIVTNQVLTPVATAADSKTYEIIRSDTAVGLYQAIFTAKEGTENIVQHVGSVFWIVGDDDRDDDGIKNATELTIGTDPDDADTDNDGIQDGTERSVTVGTLTTLSTNLAVFIPDADPATSTFVLIADSDADGLRDGQEDANFNGRIDAGETNPRDADSDDDFLLDGTEVNGTNPTNPLDSDSDNDGLLDGVEDVDLDGTRDLTETNPNVADTDADGLGDGIEVGGTNPTNPLDSDSDNDGLSDGAEDTNANGGRDANETDPNNSDSDSDLLSDAIEKNGTNPTNPLDSDSDNDGLIDGVEDADRDGALDLTETNPNDADSDNDVLTDGAEVTGTNPTNPLDADSDNDGLSDGAEDVSGNGGLNAGETNPNDADSDNDGLLDGTEVDGANPTNPLDADSDNDGLVDGVEDANLNGALDLTETNPNVADTDTDGLLDGTEVNGTNPTDPLDSDSDGDGLFDGAEDTDLDGTRDATETNPNDADSDDDLLNDGVEVTGANPTNPLDADSDNDGLGDGLEDANKDGAFGATETNPNDADTDNDLLGDGVEDANGDGLVSAGETDPRDADSDNDGLVDGTEVNGTNPTDPLDPDTDGDGLVDGVEDANLNGAFNPTETDPNVADSDADGLSDGTEVNGTNPTDPLDGDTDGDGRGDGAEDANANGALDAGETNPNDPDSDDDGIEDGPEVAGTNPTNPLDADSDDDGRTDGAEDANRNGGLNAGETNPNDADSDDDGILDGPEVAGTNPTNPLDSDSDDDGRTDGAEDANGNGGLNAGETNPNDADSDDDGILDGPEVAGTNPTNPLDADSDDDGRTDGAEDANGNGGLDAGETNPNDDDSDNDGIKDGPELTGTNPTNPLDADSDDDGRTDGAEDANGNGGLNTGETNPNDADSDDDGIQDGPEVAGTNPTNPLDADSDDDGRTDGAEDANGNGGLDAGETNPNDDDSDNDGIEDGPEVAGTNPTNPLDSDSDDDGRTDGAEDTNGNGGLNAGETNPNDADSDDDGVQDGPEVAGTNPTNPLDADSDNDGRTDGQEDANGNGGLDAGETNPNDNDSDNDGIEDGPELTGTNPTNPLDADSDDDGRADGTEDANGNGGLDAGETNPNDADSDNDGVLDGPEVTGTNPTNPLDADSDDDLLSDGAEDANGNGGLDIGETDPNDGDSDNDLVNDGPEVQGNYGTNRLDDDTDDDGVLDGNEDLDGDGSFDAGETSPVVADSDGDGVRDGVEMGIAVPQGQDTGAGYVADADVNTQTNPLDDDSDDDGILDGNEDLNANGARQASELDPGESDSDGDGLEDGIERGLIAAQGTGTANFLADQDPGTVTDPLDDDSDDDGLLDGSEDLDRDGAATLFEVDPTDFDSDADGLGDGLESGLGLPEGSGTDLSVFVADADDASTTSAMDDDTDDDGLVDGAEDVNGDGASAAIETDNGSADSDGDGVQDGTEIGQTVAGGVDTNLAVFVPDADAATVTSPLDDDTDDDGLLDGNEDEDGNGARLATAESDPLGLDSDADGVGDGVEAGLAAPQGTGTDAAVFVADLDPTTTTNRVVADTDDGGLIDGAEDLNGNGAQDARERNPNDARDDRNPSIAGAGGCGCSLEGAASASGAGAGRGMAGSVLLTMLAMAALLFARRREVGGSQRALPPAPSRWEGGIVVSLVAVLMSPALASAQAIPPADGFELQRFHAAPPSDGFRVVRDVYTQPEFTWAATFLLSYADRPLQFNAGGSRAAGIVDGLTGGEIAVGVGLRPDLEITGALPLTLYQNAPQNFYTETFLGRQLAEGGVNDARFGVKYRFLEEQGELIPALAAIPGFTVPLGGSRDLMGAESVTFTAALTASKRFGPISSVANLGYALKPKARIGSTSIDDEIAWGLGGRMRVPALGDRLDVSAELFGATVVRHFGQELSSPNELALSARWNQRPGLSFYGGAGSGLGDGFGAPSFRLFAGINYGFGVGAQSNGGQIIAPDPAPVGEAIPEVAPVPEPEATETPTPAAEPAPQPESTTDAVPAPDPAPAPTPEATPTPTE